MTPDPGPLPKLHPRRVQCELARQALSSAIDRIAEDYELTPSETLLVVAQSYGRHVEWYAEAAVRQERKDG